MEKKKVLITYATYGSGHKTVANYIYEYFVKHNEYEVKIIDLMDYENIIGHISKKAFEQNFKHKTLADTCKDCYCLIRKPIGKRGV